MRGIQSTLVISKSRGLSEILRDIRSSTYQICRIEEKINRTTTFHKWICKLTPEARWILKILWKRGEIAPKEQFLLFSTIFCYLLLDFHIKAGTRFSIRDKRLFEISKVEIMRVDCIIPTKTSRQFLDDTHNTRFWGEIRKALSGYPLHPHPLLLSAAINTIDIIP